MEYYCTIIVVNGGNRMRQVEGQFDLFCGIALERLKERKGQPNRYKHWIRALEGFFMRKNRMENQLLYN